MKILFIMDKRVNAGSIQAVSSYVLAGDELGHTIALFGRDDPRFPRVRFSTEVSAFDYVVFVIESGLFWMSGLRMPRILSQVPRERRIIIDTDGMYNKTIAVAGYDRNHATDRDRSQWLAHYDLLSDKILQPTFEPREPGIGSLPFFGYDPNAQICPSSSSRKQFDIVHVGHNWWRWPEISNCLLPAFEQTRTRFNRICFVGAWWDAPPSSCARNLKAAFVVDREWLRRLGIQVKPPVPYTEVIPIMNTGCVNIMTQRPLLRHLKLLTSKYFEIFCADTIPLVMLDPEHAELVYGPAGRDLALCDGIAEKLLDVLSHPKKYREIVQEVRQHLMAHHSYQKRLQELVDVLSP